MLRNKESLTHLHRSLLLEAVVQAGALQKCGGVRALADQFMRVTCGRIPLMLEVSGGQKFLQKLGSFLEHILCRQKCSKASWSLASVR